MNSVFPVATGFHLRRTVAALGGALLALGSSVALADETTFVGTAAGCFGIACVPGSSAASGGLTYLGSSFNVTTVGGFVAIGNEPGTPNVNNLGSFDVPGAAATYNAPFSLLVTFSAPPLTTPGSTLYSTVVTGSALSTDNGGINIDFDNAVRHFTFGSGATAGSFDFSINDLSVTAGHIAAVTGKIQSVVSAVPEPETYALFLAGLGAVGFMARRRKS